MSNSSSRNNGRSSCVSVLRVASTNPDSADNLVKSILSYFLSSQQSEEEENKNLLNISNKYFVAKVVMADILEEVKCTSNFKEDGVILIFDNNNDGNGSFDKVTKIDIDGTVPEAGDLLRLCIGVNFHGSGPTAQDDEYSRRILWCLDRGYEYIEADCSAEGLQQGHDERDKEGFARIIEAIAGTVWSSAIMKSRQQQHLKQSYDETRTKLLSSTPMSSPQMISEEGQGQDQKADQQQKSAERKEIQDFEESKLDCDEQLKFNEEEDRIREEKAREAILEQCVPDEEEKGENGGYLVGDNKENLEREDRKSEQLFDQFEGALREATKIRDASRKGELSDQERKQRAEDAAVLLMGLMNQMGFDDDDDDEEEQQNQEQEKKKEQEQEENQEHVDEQVKG